MQYCLQRIQASEPSAPKDEWGLFTQIMFQDQANHEQIPPVEILTVSYKTCTLQKQSALCVHAQSICPHMLGIYYIYMHPWQGYTFKTPPTLPVGIRSMYRTPYLHLPVMLNGITHTFSTRATPFLHNHFLPTTYLVLVHSINGCLHHHAYPNATIFVPRSAKGYFNALLSMLYEPQNP